MARVFFLLTLLLAVACGARSELNSPSGRDSGVDTETPDTFGDAAPDTFEDPIDPMPDTFADVAPDIAPDVEPDVTPDVAPDVTPDVAPDVPADTSVEITGYCPTFEDFGFDPGVEEECPDRCRAQPRERDVCDGATRVEAGTVLEDTTWSGRICAEGQVGILRGVTLTVAAGTEVYFGRGASIRVEGTLRVEGTADAIVRMSSSLEMPRVNAWSGINVQLSEGGRAYLDYAIVEFASYGIATWESDPFTTVGEEITVEARHTLFQHNGIAAAPDDNSRVTLSTVVCNREGIWVASEDEPVQDIINNNICDNIEAGMVALQDHANARDTYWCATTFDAIHEQIRDERDDVALGGLIEIEPWRMTPVPDAPALP